MSSLKRIIRKINTLEEKVEKLKCKIPNSFKEKKITKMVNKKSLKCNEDNDFPLDSTSIESIELSQKETSVILIKWLNNNRIYKYKYLPSEENRNTYGATAEELFKYLISITCKNAEESLGRVVYNIFTASDKGYLIE